MASIIPGYNYDIFISYRQKDNKHDGWVTEFVDNLKGELESTFKEEISVYFDINPHDGLLETHDVDESLKEKLKCLVFIPILSRTYCDPKSFAWDHEFKAFIDQASRDQFGLKVKLPGGNVANRVLPVRIHDLDNADIKECESVLGGFLRGIEFIYKEPGVNRPLAPKDSEERNLNHTNYRNQINKAALAVRDLIESMKIPVTPGQVTDKETQADIEERLGKVKTPEIKKHNLPISTTSFIGREKEMKEVRDLFRNSRLVTLTGAGGCGKTRLAREIALTLVEEYKDGVWFVDLASVTDPHLITKSITEVLSIKEEPTKPIIDTLTDNIRDKSLLILLDNCEHLIGACAGITDRLLQSVKGIRILATSREALNIPGEVMWRIPSLSFPDPGKIESVDEVHQYDAIKLFADRAGSNKPGFAINDQNVSPVTGICQRVDGIPLAIELAATRMRHISLETILERLNDQFNILFTSIRTAPERQQTLKATIDWSYNLLSVQEQLLFNRLSVFAGDFSLEATEEICQDDKLRKADILSFLSQLVDKSLIITISQEDESLRYRYLEPIRQYSLQKLIDSKEEECFRKNHLDYYLRMAENAYEEQFNAMAYWTAKLEKEHDNLLSALEWAEHKYPDDFMLLTGALSWFWRMHAHLIIGTEYLKRALTGKKEKTGALARILCGTGLLVIFSEGMTKGTEMLLESLKIWRELGNIKEQAIVLQYLGLNEYADNPESALKYCEEGLELAKQTGDRGLINSNTIYVCQGLVILNYIDRANTMAKQLLVDSKDLNQPIGIMTAEHFLGDCAILRKNFKEAEEIYSQGMQTSFQFGEYFMAIQDMIGVAMSVSGQLRFVKTIRLNAAAEEQARHLGFVLPKFGFWGDLKKQYINDVKEKMTKEQVLQYEEEGKNMGFESAIRYALDFDRD